MKNNKKINIPRAMLKHLTQDIAKLIGTNEGNLSILDIIEEIPYDIRTDVIEGLSCFYDAVMVEFFELIRMEYGKEFELICNRALVKYKLAGLPGSSLAKPKGSFYRSFASISRHTGRMTVDVAWQKPDGRLYVECFFLAFSSDGIHSFFVIEDMPIPQYELDREMQADLMEMNYQETCLLINDAYKFNVRFMSRPALGKFLYQKYLDDNPDYDSIDANIILRKLSTNLTPRQLVNSFFRALRYQDLNYISSILTETKLSPGMLLQAINKAMNPGALLLEGQVEEVRGFHNNVELSAYSITLYEREVYRSDYIFTIIKNKSGDWLINRFEQVANHKLEEDSAYNPFRIQVHCRVYAVVDVDDLFEVLDRVENIREVDELPYGMHMRVTCQEDDYNHGVRFMSGVIADLVINGDEFVVISQEHGILEDFHNLFTVGQPNPLVPRGEYEISLTNAYSYLSGHYLQFEDILLRENDDLSFEDGMRFITARYATKDRAEVLQRLEALKSVGIDLPGQYQVFYQLDESEHPRFMAEYILGPNWVTVSAFGDKDIGNIRQCFEEDIYDALEFDGLEIREEGMFEILSLDVKKKYPQLEAKLKDIYLNKWCDSQLATLRGMSPSEACQTEEGKRLLWTMFKRIKKKEQQRFLQGERKQIKLNEYIRKLNFTHYRNN